MMRLADYLLHWTGEVSYLDYWERNLYNGILAQQNPETGMVAYFLPMQAGANKKWGTPTKDFWCCHGTLVQAHTIYANHIYYEDSEGLVLGHYIPSQLTWECEGTAVQISLAMDQQLEQHHRPNSLAFDLTITCERPQQFTLKIRVPWWASAEATIAVNGERQTTPASPCSYASLHRTWENDVVHVEIPKRLTSEPLPDDANLVAFMDGPVVLAGLCGEEHVLYGDPSNPEAILTPDNERKWVNWRQDYRTQNQSPGARFVPLHTVLDESFAIYFPIKENRP